MSKPVFRGIYCPLATPFDYRGELYPAKIRHNLTRLNHTALTGYVVADLAGEGPLLSADEKRRLFAEIAEAAGEDKFLIAAVSSESTVQSLRLAVAAKEAGFEFTAARPVSGGGLPGRGKATQALYFRTLADQSPLPVIVLNDGPGKVAPATLLEISEHPNVAAVAGSGDDLSGLTLSLNEHRFSADWAAGVRAFVAPLANVIPFYLLCVEEALRTREEEAARELEARGRAAFETIFARLGVAGLKRAMDLRGAFGGAPRLPDVPLTMEDAAEVKRLLEGLAS